MNNTYTTKKGSILEIYNDIEKFINKLALFQESQPKYKCDITVNKSESVDTWVLSAKIWKDEQNDNKVLEEVTNPFGVL